MAELEYRVLACRPVDWDERYQRLAAAAGVPGPTPVYPGSVRKHCQDCGVEVWLGPQGQAQLGAVHKLLCFLCALDEQAASPLPTEVRDLGNPYLPADRKPEQ